MYKSVFYRCFSGNCEQLVARSLVSEIDPPPTGTGCRLKAEYGIATPWLESAVYVGVGGRGRLAASLLGPWLI